MTSVWDVTINGTDHYVIEADTAADAASLAGDAWRAANTLGEDVGAIRSVEVHVWSTHQ